MCAWIRISNNFQGVTDALLPSRWYNEQGTIIFDTLTDDTTPAVMSGYAYDTSKKGEWQHYCEVIVMVPPQELPVRFHVFIGRRLGSLSMPHTVGTVEVTLLEVTTQNINLQNVEAMTWLNAPTGLLGNPDVSYVAYSKSVAPYDYKYLGCFLNSGDGRTWILNSYATDVNTVKQCGMLRSGQEFIALEYGGQCWNGWGTRHTDGHTKLPDSKCESGAVSSAQAESGIRRKGFDSTGQRMGGPGQIRGATRRRCAENSDAP